VNSTAANPILTEEFEDLYGFEPSAERVRFLDQRMRTRLADSLRHIWEQGEDLLQVPSDEFQEFLNHLEKRPVSPLAFSFYSDTVLAIEEDDIEEASRLLQQMVSLRPHPGGILISELGDPQRDPIAQRYARLLLDPDDSLKFEIFPPPDEAAAKCRRLIKEAFDLMDAGDPELAAEIRALLREIVLAAGTLESKAMTFDGASAFMLWGAIIINGNQPKGELTMLQMLAHESSHNLLFGFSADEPLVENSPDELFGSPLRMDPRPMDGIYHATFVLARMHRAVKGLLDSGILSATQKEIAEKDLADNARLFANGIETVDRFGKLTPLGKIVMEGAKAYMASAR
jgi:HEXXH motif-containing protein